MKHLLAASLLVATTSNTLFATCQEDRVDLRGDFGSARFSVEVAETPQEVSVGLMNRS